MKGFTLIEMLVSVAIFSIVMVIALGALLAISVSDRKAESLKSVINNLNFSLDSISRSIRTGTSWGCNASHGIAPTAGVDCTGGANAVLFTAAPTAGSSGGIVTYYRLESTLSDPSNAASVCNQGAPNIGCIAKSTDGVTWLPITSPEVIITDCSGASGCTGSGAPSYLFYMVGSPLSSDTTQPKLVITLSGYVNLTGTATSQAQCGTAGAQCSVFHLQTAVTQRIYDQ